jgi:hypothetical protein
VWPIGNEAADEAINPVVWGALTPDIIALNLQYFGDMWPTNAAAGAGFGAVLRAAMAALLVPAPPAVSGASPAAGAAAAAALAQTAVVNGVGAAMRAAEQGATAVLAPAAGASGMAASMVSAVSSAPPVGSAPPAQPLAAVQVRPVAPAQALAPAPTPAGMFAPQPSAAVITAPLAPNPTLGDAPLAQTMTPRPGPVAGPVAGPMPAPAGVSSFIRPADPFAPPSAGRATGVRPGMLNAAALRGPVTNAPTTTAVGPTAVQPLAYVPPSQPVPQPSTPPPLPAQLADPGQAQHAQPAAPPQQPPPTPLRAPPAPSGPPAPANGAGGPGSGAGIQMLGFGPGGAPQAPTFPLPLDPSPPPVPPPSPPGQALLPPPIPSWASPAIPKSVQEAQQAYEKLIHDIERHNSWRPDSTNPAQVQAYNNEAWNYNTWKAELESKLNEAKAEYTPAKEAVSLDIPSWTQPAPPTTYPHEGPGHWGPSGEDFGGFSKTYPQFITGHPISDAYMLNGVKFDGYLNGILTEVKGHYAGFVDPATGRFQAWWADSATGGIATISQAVRQLAAAAGNPIQWIVAEPEAKVAFEQLFADAGLDGITIRVVPMS